MRIRRRRASAQTGSAQTLARAASTGLAWHPPWREGPASARIKADFAPSGMIREQALLSPHRRPPGAAAGADSPSAGLEQEVVARLMAGAAGGPDLVEAIAELAARTLQQGPADPLPPGRTAAAALGEAFDPQAPVVPAEVRGLAARIATGLAVALLQSDLAERITERLAAEAPFAEGWLSCPE